MLRIAILLALCARTWADPRCSTSEPTRFAIRGGVEGASVGRYDYSGQLPQRAALSGEVEAGIWVMDNVTLTGVAGSYTRFHYTDYPGIRSTDTYGRFDGRLALHSSTLPIFVGVGTGVTLESRVEASHERSLSHDFEVVAGGTIARAGPIAFELMGALASGGMDDEQLLLGVAWDPPRPQRCHRAQREGFVAAVRVGPAYTDVIWSGDEPAGWGPWLEAEVGARVSPRWALLAFATYSHLSDDVLVQDPPTDFLVHYDETHLGFGARAQLWLVPRVFASAGLGVEAGSVRRPDVPVFVQLELGVELAKLGPAELELTDLFDVSPIGATTGFALGVAYR